MLDVCEVMVQNCSEWCWLPAFLLVLFDSIRHTFQYYLHSSIVFQYQKLSRYILPANRKLIFQLVRKHKRKKLSPLHGSARTVCECIGPPRHRIIALLDHVLFRNVDKHFHRTVGLLQRHWSLVVNRLLSI